MSGLAPGAGRAALGSIFLASLRQRRMATLLSLVAIALGVALGLAVQLIQSSALDEFGRGMRRLAGEADLQVLGSRGGFDETLYLTLAQMPEVEAASPVLEIEARLPGHESNLRVLGIDLFRVAQVQPALLPQVRAERDNARDRLAALRPDAIFLSPAARVALRTEDGELLRVQSGLEEAGLQVAGSIAAAGVGERFAVMDLGAAQQLFGRIGTLTRIDLRLAPGVERREAEARIAARLPPGVAALAPEDSAAQSAGLSRAYRVNLAMLAAIALLTGAFLVFSTQLLSVVRRRQEFALLRALGLDRRVLLRGLLAEGAFVGLVGGVLGVVLGYGLTALAFRVVGADLGAGYFRGVSPELRFQPLVSFAYLMLGVVAGVAGAALPAREATRIAPARALHAGDEMEILQARPRTAAALGCLMLAGLACLLPPWQGVPVAGYAAVAFLLAAAVLLLPGATRWAMGGLAGRRGVLAELAQARLVAAPGQVVVAGAGVVASVALAVSMAIMVHSFRLSVDDWLRTMLPADLYLRASSSAASGHFDAPSVARVAAVAGVAAVREIRFETLRLSARLPPVTLIARPLSGGAGLPLVEPGDFPRDGLTDRPPVWVSEAMADLFALGPGDFLKLPLGGLAHEFRVAGVWRDYARQHGAVALELEDYRRLSGDGRSNDLAVEFVAGADPARISTAIAALFEPGRIELASPGEIRALSLAIFDRTFFITWLMEAVAILIGLFGIATTFAALSISRTKEFGMLRHLGMVRSQIGRLLAHEGALTAAIGVALGCVAGGAVALVLIRVINRQSFHWSMDVAIPVGLIAGFAGLLVVLAALAARASGAAAMRGSAVQAVREDW